MIKAVRAALGGALAGLTKHNQFIIYRLDTNQETGKSDKIPLTPNLQPGNPHDPANWLTADGAAMMAAVLGAPYSVGFVITEASGVWCLDIDGALVDNKWSDLACDLLTRLAGCAVEVSVSGRGLHIWGCGPVPPHRKRNAKHHLELYTDKRFIALSGVHAYGDVIPHDGLAAIVAEFFQPDAPREPGSEPLATSAVPDEEVVQRALNARQSAAQAFGGKVSFRDLWTRNLPALSAQWPSASGAPYDASSADAALAAHLAFWTGRDHDQIERLMRASGIGQARLNDGKGKYDPKRADYLERTISNAVDKCTTVYQPRSLAPLQPAGGAVASEGALILEYQTRMSQAGTYDDIVAVAREAANDSRMSRVMLDALRAPLQAACGLVNVKLRLSAAGELLAPPARAHASEAAFVTDHEGNIIGSQTNVVIAARLRDLKYDAFSERIVIDGRRLSDNDFTAITLGMEAIPGFPTPHSSLVKAAVRLVAEERTIDTAQEWLFGLAPWDGVPRVETLLIRVFGLTDNLYHRAVSRYLWSAIAGRIVSPGIKVDMVPILISEREGLRKSTFVQALAPDPAFYGKLDKTSKRDDLSRKIIGKIVLEWDEMHGIKTRAKEEILAFVTQQHEQWTPKYIETERSYARRCVFVGTTNDSTPLPSSGRGRRWLPVTICKMGDTDILERERDQLYAEALAIFQTYGIEYELADSMGDDERGEYRETSTMAIYVTDFLNSYPPAKFGEVPVARGLGKITIGEIKHYITENHKFRGGMDDAEISKILAEMGYEKKRSKLWRWWERNL